MTVGLYAIERAAIETIIRQYPDLAEAPLFQLVGATVSSRRHTGKGFFTDLHVSDDAPLVVTSSPISDPFADVDGLEHGMGFLLWVREGKMVCLEGYSFGEATLPINFENVAFSIVDQARM